MPRIEIDKSKCVKCKSCVKDCISFSLETDENGFAKVSEGGENRCLNCTHCMAICPTGAISINNKNPQDAHSIKQVNPDDILNLIQSRRSIRQYQETEIPAETFEKLKSMFPYIPTGCNTNTLHFSIIKSKSAMDSIRNFVRESLLKILKSRFMPKLAEKFAKYQSAFENGEDVIFRGAPHMIIVSSSIHAPCANVDPIIALSYIELYAQSLGLGTCWCGFAQACFKLIPELSQKVDIPDGYKPVYVMLLGLPGVKYHRTTLPEKFPISEIVEVEDKKMGWTQKARRILLNFIR